MLPEFVPVFVFKVKSLVPFVVMVTFSLLPPIFTVSVSKLTSPVPFGAIVTFALDVDTIEFPLRSKSAAS